MEEAWAWFAKLTCTLLWMRYCEASGRPGDSKQRGDWPSGFPFYYVVTGYCPMILCGWKDIISTDW